MKGLRKIDGVFGYPPAERFARAVSMMETAIDVVTANVAAIADDPRRSELITALREIHTALDAIIAQRTKGEAYRPWSEQVTNWEAYAGRLLAQGKENTAEYAGVIARMRGDIEQWESGDHRHLESLLEYLQSQAPDLPADKKAKGKRREIKVVEKGKVTRSIMEDVPDYRPEAWRLHRETIGKLLRALQEGDDPRRIAWLALQVGGGTTLQDAILGQWVRAGGTPSQEQQKETDRLNKQIHREVSALLSGDDHGDDHGDAQTSDAVRLYRREKAKKQKANASEISKPMKKTQAYATVAAKRKIGWKRVSRIYLDEERKLRG